MQEVGSFFDSLTLYVTNNILVVVFLIAALYILKKSGQKQRKYFIAVAITAVLLVFNGVTFAVVKWIGEDTTYYRFFWICPIVLASAYLLVELLFEVAVTRMQKVALVVVFVVMVFGNHGQSYGNWVNIPTNVYQIDDDIVQLGDLIDAHTGGERTILLANNDVSSHIREYNANVISNPDGIYYLDAIINGDKINYPARNVMMFMDSNMAEYIAIEKEKVGTNRLFVSIGSEKIGETDNFNLYYYDYEMLAEEWEIFDNKIGEDALFVNSEYVNIPGLEEQKDYLYVTDLWINTTEIQKQAIIDLANELQVEAVIINGSLTNVEFTSEFLESELAGLEVPYIYNNNGIQQLEEEKFSVVCMAMEMEETSLDKYLTVDKPVVLVLDNRIYLDGENDGCVEQILSAESSVVQVISGNSGFCKEMLNDKIMQYCARDVSAREDEGFVTLLRLKGLEAE